MNEMKPYYTMFLMLLLWIIILLMCLVILEHIINLTVFDIHIIWFISFVILMIPESIFTIHKLKDD